ncbi:DMT family transporter [Lysinibacillus sp. SGAir0095]|uniref:DMT family transporter n=1 Tax=Lysinibacillus sp. SGAir0095 TaxID=2070463 RepID=UPI0010CD0E77|nr:DMT family transporter [Lysinibacillus sp. SGAir0095]QCR31914.1 EamA family transporter [Lysinibacillus sp. SGAir0095]
MSQQTLANMLLIVINAFWGLSYVFMKLGLGSLQAFNIVGLRFLLAFLIAGILFYKCLMLVTRKVMISSLMLGTVLFGVFTFVTFGVSMTSASNAGFLVSLTVIFVPLINCLLVRRLPTWQIFIGLIFILTGIGLLTLKQSLTINLGDLLCIVGALLYAIFIILTGKLTKEDDPLTLGILQLGVAGVLAMICSVLFENPSLPSTSKSWIAILGLGILCSAVGFIGQTIAQKYTSSTHTGLIFALEPIFAAMFAVIFLKEVFMLKDIISCSIVILGIVIAQVNMEALSKLVFNYKNLFIVRKRDSDIRK